MTGSISCSNFAGALNSPKGITVNFHSPCPVKNAFFSLSSGCSSTCQYPLFRSNVENQFASARVSRVSSVLGSGKQSFIVKSFNLRFSTQKRMFASFLLTSTAGDDQGLSDSSITPLLFMSSSMTFTFACFAKGILRCG